MKRKSLIILLFSAVALMGISMNVYGIKNNIKGTKHQGVASTTKDSVKVEAAPIHEASVVDEVIWVVGDEPILKSDVEQMRLQGESEGIKWTGDPDCSIPEQIAVQKLFLHQAAIDSIEVTDAEVANAIDSS